MTIRRQYLASYGLDEHAEAGDVQREPGRARQEHCSPAPRSQRPRVRLPDVTRYRDIRLTCRTELRHDEDNVLHVSATLEDGKRERTEGEVS